MERFQEDFMVASRHVMGVSKGLQNVSVHFRKVASKGSFRESFQRDPE